MVKKSLLFFILSTVAGSAFSAPVVNLKVKGTITPPTCTVNGNNSQDVIYTFDVAPGVFPASGNLTMTGQTKNIEVVCDATTYLSFSTTDQRSDSVMTAGSTNFGLGTYGPVGSEVNVGYYQVTMQNATTKDSTDGTIKTVGVQVGSTYGTSGKIDGTMTTSWATAKDTLAPGQIFAADFVVTPTLNGALKNSDGTAALNGYAVLAFTFGV